MLLKDGPREAKSEMKREFFSSKQEEVLMKLRSQLAAAGGEEATDVNNPEKM